MFNVGRRQCLEVDKRPPPHSVSKLKKMGDEVRYLVDPIQRRTPFAPQGQARSCRALMSVSKEVSVSKERRQVPVRGRRDGQDGSGERARCVETRQGVGESRVPTRLAAVGNDVVLFGRSKNPASL